MAEALLGCPHCGKPIAFAAELAGRLAACPHCRGPFQMPASPPQPVPPSAPAPAPAPSRRQTPPSLGFDPDEPPTQYKPGERRGQEPFYYPNAESYSLLTAICGIVLVIMLSAVLVLNVIVPLFQAPGFKAFFVGFIGALGVLALLVGGIVGSLLLRNVVLVIVDGARQLRDNQRTK